MSRPTVLFAHERRTIVRAVELALDAHGFEMVVVQHGDQAAARLKHGDIDALVVDVGIPGTPSFELVEVARAHQVRAVILVASIYSRTSYKRAPKRLYGADEYVEIHHLGDQLPRKLRARLELEAVEHERSAALVAESLRAEGDRRLEEHIMPEGLAALIAADVVLYNGDAVAGAATVDEAHRKLEADLEGGREVFRRAREAAGGKTTDADADRDYVGEALDDLLAHLVHDVGAAAQKPTAGGAP